MASSLLFLLLSLQLGHLVTSDQPLVRPVGGSVDLNPGSIKEKIKSITWKHNGDLVSEWNGDQVTNYREFEGRCELNTSTGVLRIRDLKLSDRGTYTAEINNRVGPSLTVIVSDQLTLVRSVDGSLNPGPIEEKITSIIWKLNSDFISEWNGDQVTNYRDFKGRCELDTSTGVLRIRDLRRSDRGTYTAEINNVVVASLLVQVFALLPKPTVSTRCNDEKTSCDLTCEACITADMEPVEFSWKKDDKLEAGNQTLTLTKEDKETSFMCLLTNPVDSKSSEEVENPLIYKTNYVGLIVGLVAVFILVISLLSFLFIRKKLNERIRELEDEVSCIQLPLVRPVGGSVDLNPGPIEEKITSITWKLNGDIVSKWNGDQVTNYSDFKDRCELNTETGLLRIRDLILLDSGIYRVEINFRDVASHAVQVFDQSTLVRPVGGSVDLNPGSIEEKITSIIWKLNKEKVSEWNGDQVTNYRDFKGRCELNTETGVLTIRRLILLDSGFYRVQINNRAASLTVRVSEKQEETSTVYDVVTAGRTEDLELEPLNRSRTTNHDTRTEKNFYSDSP